MLFSSVFLSTMALSASALPFTKRADPTDVLVLKFAGVLERLETAFYQQAIAKFSDADFVAGGFGNVNVPKEIFTTILGDEEAHTSILETTILANGDQPVTTCQFDFTSALTDVATMAATARVVEMVGVSAYMGAAPLMVNKELLTAAAGILTIEARHQTLLNILNGGSAVGQAFDMALSPSQVLALAGPFVSGCDLGIPANPPLSVTASPSLGPGAQLSFTSTGIDGLDPNTLSCQMMTGGAPFAISFPLSECVVPSGINGPVYIFLTNDTVPLINSQVNQFSSSIVAGPTLVFLDTKPETLGSLARGSSGPVITTSTITPEQASSIVAGAQQTPPPTATPLSQHSAPPSGGPNPYTGPSHDGTVEVIGWVSQSS